MARKAICVPIMALLAGLMFGCATQSDLDRIQGDIGRIETDVKHIKRDIKGIRNELRMIKALNRYGKLRFLAKRPKARTLEEIWVLVNTRSQSLSVLKGNKPISTFKNIAIGRDGAGYKQRVGDNKTPLGEFRIGWVNHKSRYRLFFGLNYPSPEYAERGLRSGLINPYTYRLIKQAAVTGNRPPQYTPLGGMIGIHGLGAADPEIHKRMNWTQGCIALTNQQIDTLERWVHEGTRVVIR